MKRISKKKDKIFTNEMWRNILPMAFYQILVLVILMFTGQYMFAEKPFNVVLTQPFMKDKDGNVVQTEKMALNTLCFNTFMLMNIFNMLNCRVNTNEVNIFANLFSNPNLYFWLVFVFEMCIQVAFIWFTKDGTVAKLLYTTSQTVG